MRKTNILTFMMVVLICLPVTATIINVPADYDTIQHAIDASSDGDTVLVQPGTYYENIDFDGHNTHLASLFLTTGDTSYMVKLMKMANSSVKFKGAFNRLIQILPQFDVAVVPPIWHDNAPLVVLEALAARKPIIGADIGGIPDFVKDGTNGFLFRAGDPEDLALTMKKVIDHPRLIKHFRKNMTTPRTMHHHTTELEEVYHRLLSGREVSELEIDHESERTCT